MLNERPTNLSSDWSAGRSLKGQDSWVQSMFRAKLKLCSDLGLTRLSVSQSHVALQHTAVHIWLKNVSKITSVIRSPFSVLYAKPHRYVELVHFEYEREKSFQRIHTLWQQHDFVCANKSWIWTLFCSEIIIKINLYLFETVDWPSSVGP